MVEKENDIAPAAAAVKKSENNNNAFMENATNASANGTSGKKPEDLKNLAFHFLEAYYTKLSDHPNDIGIFYGEDSSFVLGNLEETGRENIQRAICGMNFGDCKSRFFSIQAATGMCDSKVFQVCGELTLKGQSAPRRFCQTIVLAQPQMAPPNVLYVKSNIFQWLDVGFPNESDKVQFYSPPPVTIQPLQGQPMENGGPTLVPSSNMAESLMNGGNAVNLQQPVLNTAVIPSPQPLSPEPTIVSKAPPPGMEPKPQQQMNKSPEKPVLNGFTVEKPAEVENDKIKTTDEDVTVTDAVKSEQAMPPSKPKSTEPKSWNKVVSGNQTQQNNRTHPPALNNAQPPHKKNVQQAGIPKTNSFPAVEQHQQQPKVKENSAPNASPPPNATDVTKKRSSSNDDGAIPFVAPRKDWPHRIYFNNLNKPGRFVDFKVGQQQFMKHLKGITQGVEFVAIKPLSLRKEYKHAFGFVDLTTAEDMQAVYDAAKKDDEKTGSNKQLKVCIPEFEFDGYITLTNDKTTNLPIVPGFYGGGGRPHNQPQQNFHRGGEQHQRKMAQPTKG